MGKRKLRFRAQGSHKNKYEGFSKPSGSVELSNFEKENCDYYKLGTNHRYIVVYSTDKEKSSVLSLRYYPNKEGYSLNVRTVNGIIFKSSIDDFFDMAFLGFQERAGLEKNKKKFSKHLEKD